MQAQDKRLAGEAEVQKVIDTMAEPDQRMAKRLHKVIMEVSPDLIPRTWYGMPAYTMKTKEHGDKILCFFRSRQKFGERFMTFGFNDVAALDDGNMWPIYYALTDVTGAEERQIAALVAQAAR